MLSIQSDNVILEDLSELEGGVLQIWSISVFDDWINRSAVVFRRTVFHMFGQLYPTPLRQNIQSALKMFLNTLEQHWLKLNSYDYGIIIITSARWLFDMRMWLGYRIDFNSWQICECLFHRYCQFHCQMIRFETITCEENESNLIKKISYSWFTEM